MLRDLRIGSPIYILNKKEMSIEQAEVLQCAASAPAQFGMFQNGNMPPRQTVDLRVRYGGKEIVFQKMFADLSSCEDVNGNGIVVCESKDSLLSEIKAFKMNTDNILSQREYYEKISRWCDEQIVGLDPVKQAEIQSAKQIEAIKNEFATMLNQRDSKIDELTRLVKSFVGGGKGKE